MSITNVAAAPCGGRHLPRVTVLALAICGASCSAVLHAQTYRYVSEFGTTGSGTLDFPNEVQIDPASHHLFVSDAHNNRVVEFNAAGAYLNAFGSGGSGNGQFSYPAGVAIDTASHNVFVADYYGDRVEVFSASGTYLSQFSIGAGNNACAIAIQPGSHDILVSDGFAASVQIYTPGEVYAGSFGSATNFGYACGMTIAPNGNIMVADQTRNNVQVFNASGGALFAFGSAGSGDGQFATPSPGGVAVDTISGNIVVTDYGNDRVQIFDSQGQYLAQFGASGSGPGQFHGPTGVAIDPATHNLFVADRGNDRIQEFSSCGPTQVDLGVLPQTQQQGQPILFSASISNALSPSGIVSIFGDDGTLICTAVSYGDPQAACSGFLQLGVHTATAVYSGNNSVAPGCSSASTVAVVPDLMHAPPGFTLVGPPNGIGEGDVFTLDATIDSGAKPASDGTAGAQPAGFVTFYDGSNVLAQVVLSGNQASYGNRISGGAHSFSAIYSGDGNFATANAAVAVVAATAADEIYYDSFEIPRGN